MTSLKSCPTLVGKVSSSVDPLMWVNDDEDDDDDDITLTDSSRAREVSVSFI